MNARIWTAAAALAFLSAAANAALVNVFVPVSSPPTAPATVVPREMPETEGCTSVDQAVYGLESSIYQAEAQHWAHLMREPGFSIARSAAKPGMDISHPDLRSAFYRELAVWSSLEDVPDLSENSLRRINDVSMKIRLIRDVCRAG